MTLAALSIAVIFLAAALAFVLHRLTSRFSEEALDAEWLDSFSVENYAPMRRLLDQSDLEFFKKQPGFRPALAKRLQAERQSFYRLSRADDWRFQSAAQNRTDHVGGFQRGPS